MTERGSAGYPGLNGVTGGLFTGWRKQIPRVQIVRCQIVTVFHCGRAVPIQNILLSSRFRR